jgi:hypothetical protein
VSQLSYVALWSRAFALTLVVETLVAFPLLPAQAARVRRAGSVLAAQLLTHPIVWFVLPAFGLTRFAYVAFAEAWAVIAEMVLYRLIFSELSWATALGISALANGASFAVGLLVHY